MAEVAHAVGEEYERLRAERDALTARAEAASDDSILLDRLGELEIVVSPMIGGGWWWEDQDGDSDGLRHPTLRAAGWAGVRAGTGETPDAPEVES